MGINDQFAAQMKQMQAPSPLQPQMAMPTYSMFTPIQTNTQTVAPRMQVNRVNGRKGAEKFNIGPDSSVFLMDTAEQIIWAVTTDSAGEKTVTGLAVTVIDEKAEEKKAEKDLKDAIDVLAKKLEENTGKIANLEERFKAWEDA